MFRKILNPDLYHGHNKKKNFFEGWYFKISDLKGENTFAFIPGIFLGKDDECSHSFIQIVNGKDIKYDYLKYNKEDFSAAKDIFDVEVNKSNFSLNGISLDIDRPEIKIKGKVTFHNVKKWPDTFINPGSMGSYNYLTFMQCYSQVCAMDIKLTGKININGQDISFDNGKGYIEKNWGKEFPHSWIWVQGNQFKNHNGSISCSIGHIPFPLGSFRGFLIGLMIDDDFHTFTTMNKSKIKIKQREEDVEIKVENKNYILNINVLTKKEKFMTLKGPRGDKMIPLVNENLGGIVEVRLIDIKSNKEIFKDTTICGGVEYGGDQMIILDKN
ncbi:tocopherol cyclase family protein [Dethiothermospora halolimnae]|uniref:tocopherol cyclase family protein n=1 Tax=Dethiothermospora halolimnae TaxID=3114390 RepID=UPI003CCB9356